MDNRQDLEERILELNEKERIIVNQRAKLHELAERVATNEEHAEEWKSKAEALQEEVKRLKDEVANWQKECRYLEGVNLELEDEMHKVYRAYGREMMKKTEDGDK